MAHKKLQPINGAGRLLCPMRFPQHKIQSDYYLFGDA